MNCIEIPMKNRSLLTPFFMEECMARSFLQGHMGRAWADHPEHPASAQIIIGDFCFLSGVPSAALAANIPPTYPSPFLILIASQPEWEQVIEQVHAGRYQKFTRYALKKEADVFDRPHLAALAHALPAPYTIRKIDRTLYARILQTDWSKDLCAQYPDYEAYQKYGMGYVVLYQGEIVSGASSYMHYNAAIEIEIDTHPAYQNRGLAAACGAALICACLDRGIYPSWDAANETSLRLAQRLGYHYDKSYPACAVQAT